MAGQEFLFDAGILLIIVGFVVSIVAAVLMISAAANRKGTFRGGGVVIVGPFPIIFGTDKESVKVLLILSIILVSVLFVFSILLYWLPR